MPKAKDLNTKEKTNLKEADWVTTADGTLTCFHQETGELYHNLAGALTEAKTNYVLPCGWHKHWQEQHQQSKTTLVVMDVCFGLGYNTWAFLLNVLHKVQTEAIDESLTIALYCFENDLGILKKIPAVFKNKNLEDLKSILPMLEHNIYYQTQSSPTQFTTTLIDKVQILWHFYIEDFRHSLVDICTKNIEADFIFHDAFAPDKVPMLWTIDIFGLYKQLLTPRTGKLLTYSAAGSVRGALNELGFKLYRTPELGKKKGGTLATISVESAKDLDNKNNYYFPLTSAEITHYTSRSGVPYRDEECKLSLKELRARRLSEQETYHPRGFI